MCIQAPLAISRCVCVLAFAMLLTGRASAMTEYSLGNDPVHDGNWPAGAVDVVNLKSRVCQWESFGPINFLYRGDAKALQQALDVFAKIRAPRLDVFVHDGGPSQSHLLLNPKDPKADARVDWSFAVWDARTWNQMYNNPSNRFFAAGDGFGRGVDPPRMDLFVGGKGIDFSAIKMPAGVTVTDERASAAGIAGGSAVVADFYDMETSKPVKGVQIVLRKSASPADDNAAVTGQADGNGHLLLKSVPAGTYDLVASADGYVSRMIGRAQFHGDTLKRYTVDMIGPAEISGMVTDTRGKRLVGMKVRADAIVASNGRGYPMTETKEATTDDDGHFVISGLPRGSVQLFASGKPYFPLDSMAAHAVPSGDIALRMTSTGAIKGKVYTKQATAFSGSVNANPPKDPIGKWGGSMRVAPDGSYHFEDVPPGDYVLTTDGKEMPGILIKVEAGKTTEKDLVGRD